MLLTVDKPLFLEIFNQCMAVFGQHWDCPDLRVASLIPHVSYVPCIKNHLIKCNVQNDDNIVLDFNLIL